MTLTMPEVDYELEMFLDEQITIPCEGCSNAATWIEHLSFSVVCSHVACASCKAREAAHYNYCVINQMLVCCKHHPGKNVFASADKITWEPL